MCTRRDAGQCHAQRAKAGQRDRQAGKLCDEPKARRPHQGAAITDRCHAGQRSGPFSSSGAKDKGKHAGQTSAGKSKACNWQEPARSPSRTDHRERDAKHRQQCAYYDHPASAEAILGPVGKQTNKEHCARKSGITERCDAGTRADVIMHEHTAPVGNAAFGDGPAKADQPENQ